MVRTKNFITDIIDDDLQAGRHTKVVTRFPPEPNGYLHIGHAKSICLNFGMAAQYDGQCHLRYDDTNPLTESVEYVESIAKDVAWLGFSWGEHRYFASNYFEQMYGFAMELIEKGLAYVDDQSLEQIRETRGTVTEPGKESPYRNRSVEENLDRFQRMRAGEFPDGSCVLRAKIDMSATNMIMRDPLLYRIKHVPHHRTGDAWPIYPMYDFAHCLEDALEHITHSLCTLEFENNRALYDWVIDNVSVPSKPRQIEFARLNLEYTVVSKRKLLKLVQEGVVDGWDDPRMPTISGMRRRGYTPSAIRAFATAVGITRNDNRTDIARLEYCVRDDLNHRAPRMMAVLDPLPVTITTWPEDKTEWVDADLWPHDVPKEGTRKLPITQRLYIERDDYSDAPPKGWRRLRQGGEVRLRHGYIIRCDDVIRDADGRVLELRCSHDPNTLNEEPQDGRKIKGVIHWVSATQGVQREVRLYDRLFAVPNPEEDPDVPFLAHVNPNSLTTVQGWMEPALAELDKEAHVQLERLGYFFVDPVATGDGLPVFNRVVTLRDSWAKAQEDSQEQERESRRRSKDKEKAAAPIHDRQAERQAEFDNNEELAQNHKELRALNVGEEDAWTLLHDDAARAFFHTAVHHGAPAVTAARWIVNELPRAYAEHEGAHQLTAEAFAGLAKLLDADRVTNAGGRDILAILIAQGGQADAIMVERQLEKLDNDAALQPLVDTVLQAFPDQAAAFQAGEQKLLGFLLGKVMQESGGRADAQRVRQLLLKTVS